MSVASLSILEVIGIKPVALIMESFFLPDFILDFFLSDFCLLGFSPLPVGVFDFSTLVFSSFVNEFSADDFLLFLWLFVGLFFGL